MVSSRYVTLAPLCHHSLSPLASRRQPSGDRNLDVGRNRRNPRKVKCWLGYCVYWWWIKCCRRKSSKSQALREMCTRAWKKLPRFFLGLGQTEASEIVCAHGEVQDQSPLLHLIQVVCLPSAWIPHFSFHRETAKQPWKALWRPYGATIRTRVSSVFGCQAYAKTLPKACLPCFWVGNVSLDIISPLHS